MLCQDPTDFALRVDPLAPTLRHFLDLAKSLQVYISLPFVEIADFKADQKAVASFFPASDVAFYNTVVLASPKGEIAGHYRKVKMFLAFCFPLPFSVCLNCAKGIRFYDMKF